jgi:hypothetical protein
MRDEHRGNPRRTHASEGNLPPANTLIPVMALARPGLLLEIEAVVDLSTGKQP